MAAYLKFDGGNDYVSIPSGMTLSSVGDYFEFEVNIVNNKGYFFAGTSGSFGSIFAYDTTRYRLRVPTSGTVSEITAPVPSGRTVIRLTREASGYDLIVDGTSLGSFSQTAGLSPIVLGLWSSLSISSLRLYSFEYGNTSGIIRYYDPSATGGTGLVLEDTVGTNDGTLVNFSTDDSQWVFNSWSDVGFTRLGSLTAPSVTGSATDLPTLVKFEDFTTTMLASLDTGGGDLRFSSDEAGTTQLACEVVTFTKATGDVVWVKVPAVSTGALIYVWGDNTGATQPAVDAAFGRNAVWSAFSFYSHDGGVTESTASLAMIDDGSGAVGTGQPSGADDLTAPKQRLSDASIGDTVGNYTLTSWHNGNSAGTFISRRDGSINQYQTGLTGSGSIFEYFYQDSSGTFTQFAGSALSGWHKADYVITGTSCELFIDGVSRNTIVISKGSQPAVPLRLGFRGNGGLGTVGFAYANRIGESSVCSSAKSSTQIDIEYDNQSATGAWWTAADEGGGGPVTQILTPTAIASEENFGTPSLATGLVTVTAIGIASEEAVGSVSLSTGATLLTPEDIVSQEVLGDPNLLVGATALTTESITTEEALGLISLLSQSVVLVSSITSEEIVGNPELAYEQTISVVSAHTGETMGRTTVLGGVVVISLNTVYRDVMSDVYRTTMRDGYDIRT